MTDGNGVDVRSVLDAIGACPDGEIDLADAAIQLARVDEPGADWLEARRHLSGIAREAARYAVAEDGCDLMGRADALVALLRDRYGYRGDAEHYDDPANANLLRVIERRRGLPVALGVIWLHAAQATGWAAYGVDLPGHFVVALAEQDGPRRLVLDVFDGGTALDARAVKRLFKVDSRSALGPRSKSESRQPESLQPQSLQPMSNRAVLLRLQANIRIRRIQSGDLSGALACLDDTLRIAPESAMLWREAALLQERLDQVGAALQSCQRLLALLPTGPAANEARVLMDELRTRLN